MTPNVLTETRQTCFWLTSFHQCGCGCSRLKLQQCSHSLDHPCLFQQSISVKTARVLELAFITLESYSSYHHTWESAVLQYQNWGALYRFESTYATIYFEFLHYHKKWVSFGVQGSVKVLTSRHWKYQSWLSIGLLKGEEITLKWKEMGKLLLWGEVLSLWAYFV